MLTAVQIKSLASRNGLHFVGDGSGLCLLVRDGQAGAKECRWVQRVRVAGRRREIGHGVFPAVSLAQARAAAKKVADEVAAGRDPVAERREREAAAIAAADAADRETFAAALDGYIGAHGAAWRSPKTKKQVRERMDRHAKALLKKPVRSIGKTDVLAVLRPIWTEKPVLAQQLRARMENVFEWAKAAGWRSGENPAGWRGMLQPLLAKPSAVTRNRHHPALPWAQVPAFLAALRRVDGGAARCLELVILSAVRSGEARGALRGEFDLDAALWTIPAERMKAGKPHRVPLSAPALALLRSRIVEGMKKDALLFPSPRGGAFSDMALLAVIKRMDKARTDAGEVGWRDERGVRITPHGFRAAFRSWAGDTGQPRELAEHALAHAMGDATERAYARSDLLARRARLMVEWAEHCEGRAKSALDAVPAVRIVA